jgi:hypothetical protein
MEVIGFKTEEVMMTFQLVASKVNIIIVHATM